MNSNLKKEKERYFFSIFRSIYSSFPDGSVEDNREKPDFKINGLNSNIGIEMTRIYQPTQTKQKPLQAQESERLQLVDESCRIYETLNIDPVQVNIHFSNGTNFNKNNRTKYAQIISQFVASKLPSIDSWVTIENKYDSPKLFPFELESVSIARYQALSRNTWFTPVAGFVQEDCINDFQRVIFEKDKLLESYDPSCSEYWLLIVAEWSGPSSFYEPSMESLIHIYQSKFNKIFFLDPRIQKYNQLKISSSAD